MRIVEKIGVWLENSEAKTIKNILYCCVGGFLVVTLGGVGFYRYRVNSLKKTITTINKYRKDVAVLLDRYASVKAQQSHVDQILNKKKDFKISQSFESFLQKLDLTAHKAHELETASEPVLDSYIEWTLNAQLTAISLKKLTDLLYAIEQEERIYTKQLDIERNTSGRFINVKITVATLEPNANASE